MNVCVPLRRQRTYTYAFRFRCVDLVASGANTQVERIFSLLNHLCTLFKLFFVQFVRIRCIYFIQTFLKIMGVRARGVQLQLRLLRGTLQLLSARPSATTRLCASP